MPVYQYRCFACNHEFEDVHTIDERRVPCAVPCVECGTEGKIDIIITSAMNIVSSVGDIYSKVPNVFRDRLREIKKQSGKGNTINV